MERTVIICPKDRLAGPRALRVTEKSSPYIALGGKGRVGLGDSKGV